MITDQQLSDTTDAAILFDFDGTIFDTAQLKQYITQQLRTFTTNTDILWQTEKELRSERFHLVKTMKLFCERAHITDLQDTIQKVFLQQNFPGFIFPDVIPTLQHLRKNHLLALFSEGDETYQQVKIYQSHLNALFDYVFIYHQKLPHLEEVLLTLNQKKVWYVDNQLNKLQKATHQFPELQTIWINREQLTPPIKFSPNATITTLDQLSSVL